MSFQIQNLTFKWLTSIGVLTQEDKSSVKKLQNNNGYEVQQQLANKFQNGMKISVIVQQLCRKYGLPVPNTLTHLKTTNHTAAMLYNWNILNDSLKKMGFEIDSQTKSMVVNGDRDHLNMVLRNLQVFYQKGKMTNTANDYTQEENQRIDDSLENEKIKHINNKNASSRQVNRNPQQNVQSSSPNSKYNTNYSQNNNNMRQSLSLSYSEEQPVMSRGENNSKNTMTKKESNFGMQHNNNRQQNTTSSIPQNILSPQGDLLQYIVNQLMSCLKLTKKQAVALLADNNKYLAHVLVKGVKGQFNEIEQLMQKFYTNIEYIIERMIGQNDMCFFFLQIVKPSLLSKNQEIAQWGCRILSKVANELAERQMLPLAYDWFVRQAGGLSTTILALSRHPKLNQHVVAYILEFARYNVTELFTIELKKITDNDNLNYIKFMLLIFQPLVQSKLSAQQLLTSGAIDYWVQMALKNSQSHPQNSKQLRLYSIEFLIKIWRAYPLHIEETLDQVNQIMINIKKGILQTSQIMRFSLLEIMFNLLDQFATKKNPYASILYKKLTFLFVENHEEETMREFILTNLEEIFRKFSSIPVEIFLEPFIKQVKITQNKSYFLQIFDMNFIRIAVKHKKLKVNTGIELYDLLAKIKLNNNCYVQMANQNMGILLDRFMQDQLFFDYTVKLVKISLAMFYSTLKHKKQFDDHERIQAQKRAEIINFIISLIERQNNELNEEIKNLVVHVKIQIQSRLGITHKGIERILGYFPDAEEAIQEALQNAQQTQSNATSTKTKSEFHLPKIESRNQMIKEKQRDRDQLASQQSNVTSSSKFSRGTNRSNKQFEMKEYTRFADDDEKNFMKQHNIQPSKKPNADFKARKAPVYASIQKQQSIDPKLQSHIAKLKQRKEQQQVRKIRQKQILQRKKQILKQKIQKQLEQRNIKEGIAGGNQKDVQVKVVFEENQLNEKLFQNTQEEEEVYFYRNVQLQQEEQRDSESIRIILRKNINFVKKIFTKYACSKVVKKDYFEEKTDMNQSDLIRLCKEKNLQRSKQPVLEIMKQVNNKNTKTIDIDTFPCFLENLCVFLYFKEKASTHMPMGNFLREKVLKKMAVGQNVKLDDQEDQQTKIWSQKVRYNPQIQLPQNFKKITQRIYYPNQECSYPVKKAIKNHSFLTCFQVLNQILYDAFKFNILEEQVRFKDELKVAPKKQAYLPPKPNNTKQEPKDSDDGPKGLLLKQTEQVPIRKRDNSVSKATPQRIGKNTSQSIEKQNQQQRVASSSKQRPKIVNAAEKKKLEEEQSERIKREHQEELRKIRQLQVKKKLQKEKQMREKQKEQKKDEQKRKKLQQEDKKKQQEDQQQSYKQKQKEKLEKYRKQQQEKQQAEKERRKIQREKEEQQKKQKIGKLKVNQDQKRIEEREKVKKQREMSEENKKKQKQQEEKKKEMVRKQVLKKLENQKEKYQIQKTIKELTKQVFNEKGITQIFDQNKEQLKSLWNYGKQYNEFKLGSNPTELVLQSKGFITLCQQLSICDVPTANKLLKIHQKDTGLSGFSYQQFEQTLFGLNIKPVLQKQMDNYDNAVKESQKTLRKFISKLNIPKDKLLLKDFFLNLKNGKSDNTKKRKLSTNGGANEEIQVTNNKGEKQNWEIQNDNEQ